MYRTNGEKIGAVLISLAFFPVQIFWSGFVLSILWGWFVVPLGISAIGIAHAAGLSVLLRMVTRKVDMVGGEDPVERAGWQIGVGVLAPAMGLAVGWILHLFMQ